jgi:hypothetical protein
MLNLFHWRVRITEAERERANFVFLQSMNVGGEALPLFIALTLPNAGP